MHTPKVYLTPEQINKLRRVLNPTIPIYPSSNSSNFPTLHIVPRDFLRRVYINLQEHDIDIASVRLNGGAASYVLVSDSNFAYRDIDILFCLNTPLTCKLKTKLFSSTDETYLCDVWTIIKYVICSCLLEIMSDHQNSTPKILSNALDAYTKKNIQVTSDQDSWGLLSLKNLLGKNLELKFIKHWKRQWQFSVDSFQIDLKPLLFDQSFVSTHCPRSITQTIPKQNIDIDAFNAINIRKVDEQIDCSTVPIQFGTVTPPGSPLSAIINLFERARNPSPRPTLATITTIDAATSTGKKNYFPMTNKVNNDKNMFLELTNARLYSDTASASDLNNDNRLSNEIQFQITSNEDTDDGIVVDSEGSTIEDDESVYQTPPDEIKSNANTEIQLLVEVFCNYKDIHEALSHLNNKQIATYEPEKLRGGGLLKYCDLLAQNYRAHDYARMIDMERYMCSRFFIDFKTLPEQISVITKYVASHFLPCSTVNELFERYPIHQVFQNLHNQSSQSRDIVPTDVMSARLCLLFFDHLFYIIQRSCVCLSANERDHLLRRIYELKNCYHLEYEYLFADDEEHRRLYHSFHPPLIQPFNYSERYYSASKGFGGFRSSSHRFHHPTMRNFTANTNRPYNTNPSSNTYYSRRF